MLRGGGGAGGSIARKSTYQRVQPSVKGADGEIGVESKGGVNVEDEEAAASFLLMTISRGLAEKSEPQTESSPANWLALS